MQSLQLFYQKEVLQNVNQALNTLQAPCFTKCTLQRTSQVIPHFTGVKTEGEKVKFSKVIASQV